MTERLGPVLMLGAALLLASPVRVAAEIYRWVDEQGNVMTRSFCSRGANPEEA